MNVQSVIVDDLIHVENRIKLFIHQVEPVSNTSNRRRDDSDHQGENKYVNMAVQTAQLNASCHSKGCSQSPRQTENHGTKGNVVQGSNESQLEEINNDCAQLEAIIKELP